MYYSVTPIGSEDSLEHFGIKGMKWGVRRYQNTDGSLTAKGKKRYSKGAIAATATGALAGAKLSTALAVAKVSAMPIAKKASMYAIHAVGSLAPFTPLQGAIMLGAMGYGTYRLGRKAVSAYKTKKMSKKDVENGRRKADEILKKHKKTKASNAPIAMLSENTAKKLGFDSTTKLSDKDQSEFWKAYAKEVSKKK